MAFGLLLLRLVLGQTMAAHGAQKLFGWFGGPGLEGTAGFFGKLGFRPPMAMALLAGASEFAGGLLFAAGLLTPGAALLLTAVMIIAIATVHWQKGFFATNGGYEFNLLILTVAVAVSAAGPGRFSLDRVLGWDDNLQGVWWGAGVLAAALAGSLVTLALGRERAVAHGQPT